MPNPFTPSYASLPEVIAVFPLPGAVLMPGTQLPLNIFEPRYLNLVEDTLGSHRLFGMIQPDPGGPRSGEAVLYRTGCAGRITSFSETNDGRIVLVLTGICRFDIRDELPAIRGYRRVLADWSRFAGDYEPEAPGQFDREPFLSRLRRYCDRTAVELPWEDLETLAEADLVNLLVAHLPLHTSEKQALLEAVRLDERAKLMSAFLELGSVRDRGAQSQRH